MKYKIASDGKDIGDYEAGQVLELYLGGKIQLSDFLWREGLSEWRSLYDLYPEFLTTPEQLRAYDRENMMITKTSFRIKNLLEKSKIWLQRQKEKKQKAIVGRRRARKAHEVDLAVPHKNGEETNGLDLEFQIRTDMHVQKELAKLNEEYFDQQNSFADADIEDAGENIKELEEMRTAFWQTTFLEPPEKLSKRDSKMLAESYERRVDSILRGSVPWSSLYFWANSFYWMPSSRSLYESHGKNYEHPSISVIVERLKVLDRTNPNWDENTPEIFFNQLALKTRSEYPQKNKKRKN